MFDSFKERNFSRKTDKVDTLEKKSITPQTVTEKEYQQSSDILKQVVLKYNELIKQETDPSILDLAWSELIDAYRDHVNQRQIILPFFIYLSPKKKGKIVTIRKEYFLGILKDIKDLEDEVRELEKKK